LLNALLDDDFAGSAGAAASVVSAGRAVTAVAAGAVAVFIECDEVFDVLTVAWTVADTTPFVVASLHAETNELALPFVEWVE